MNRDYFINLIEFKKLTIDAFMARPGTLSNKVRRWCRHDSLFLNFKLFGNLFFVFTDALNAERSFFGNQIPSLCHLWLLQSERGPPLDKTDFRNLIFYRCACVCVCVVML
jgi:hypothetical protein